ncbi:MAG TPA: hypothetical protein VFK89_03835 [Actinomycetota bacterium]|nr:hypothetical protein [Actinomycetota bacterium]
MNRRGLVIGFVVAAIVVVAVIVLLATGGTTSGTDGTGDVKVDDGPHAPRTVQIVDIATTSVHRDGDTITLSATANGNIPRSIANGSLEYRWELGHTAETTEWIVTVAVNVDASASLLATQRDYSSTTINDTFPGDFTIKGARLTVEIDSAQVKGFPTHFDFHVESTLDANRADTRSGLAHDRAPNEGTISSG